MCTRAFDPYSLVCPAFFEQVLEIPGALEDIQQQLNVQEAFANMEKAAVTKAFTRQIQAYVAPISGFNPCMATCLLRAMHFLAASVQPSLVRCQPPLAINLSA
jgi:hypothetical protein